MSTKKPERHTICPHFVRQVQSKYFHGIKCEQYYTADHVGQIPRWTEEQRDKQLRNYCFDNYLACPVYQNHKGLFKRR